MTNLTIEKIAEIWQKTTTEVGEVLAAKSIDGTDKDGTMIYEEADIIDAFGEVPKAVTGPTGGTGSPDPATVMGMPAWLVFVVLLLILVAPAGLFINSSFDQLGEVQTKIYELPLSAAQAVLDKGDKSKLPPSETLHAINVLAALEKDATAFRTHRLQAFNATRTWLRFMSLLFGAILVIIGASFILGKITTPESNTQMEAGDRLKVSMATTSPGLILILFGVVLILFRGGFDEKIEAIEKATYIDAFTATSLLGRAGQIVAPAASPKPTAAQQKAAADALKIFREKQKKRLKK